MHVDMDDEREQYWHHFSATHTRTFLTKLHQSGPLELQKRREEERGNEVRKENKIE